MTTLFLSKLKYFIDIFQMTRKILKCGYLFVAPDWDFNNPIYRSKVKKQI